MASIISGYAYDVFISYRHNDNRTGWVEEFVKNLQDELASISKHEVGIYFDSNPHDGLHDHHEVDDSLKDKLKCLICLPIVSRTYCDPSSFAWEHEFIVFLDLANSDSLGLKIKLKAGNVASRVLPIQIHDLNEEDVNLFESTTGSVLRPIDLIYKEPGVNRPLGPADDRSVNQEKTEYRNQVNKVANAINEILESIRIGEVKITESSPSTKHSESDKLARKPVRKSPKSIGSTINFKALVNRIKYPSLILFALAIGYLLHGFFKPEPQVLTPQYYSYTIPEDLRATGRRSVAISPDAKYLALNTSGNLHITTTSEPDDYTIIPMPAVRQLFFSHDSKWIGFESDAEALYKVALDGGAPIKICDLPGSIGGAEWYEDEILYTAADSQILRVDPFGGRPELLFELTDQDEYIRDPVYSPDRKGIVFSQNKEDVSSLYYLDLKTKKTHLLIELGGVPKVLQNGSLLFQSNDRLYHQTIDWKNKIVLGFPELVLEQSMSFRQWDISKNGVLIYASNVRAGFDREVVWVDQNGKPEAITASPPQWVYSPTISPDGQNIAVDFRDGGIGIETINPLLGTTTLFLSGDDNYLSPVWHPLNGTISYTDGKGIFEKPLDLSYEPRQLADLQGDNTLLGNWSKSGSVLLFETNLNDNSDIGYFDTSDSTIKMLDFINSGRTEMLPSISPDGKWLAFTSDRDATHQVYVVPFPGPGPLYRISTNQGYSPVWAPDMSSLYFIEGGRNGDMYRSDIRIKNGEFSADAPVTLFNGTFARGYRFGEQALEYGRFDIHPDGKKFLMIRWVREDVRETKLHILVNWDSKNYRKDSD